MEQNKTKINQNSNTNYKNQNNIKKINFIEYLKDIYSPKTNINIIGSVNPNINRVKHGIKLLLIIYPKRILRQNETSLISLFLYLYNFNKY